MFVDELYLRERCEMQRAVRNSRRDEIRRFRLGRRGLKIAQPGTLPPQAKKLVERVFGRLPGKILATGADYLGFQFAGADYLASAIRRGRLPGPAKRWGRIPGPNFRQKAGQITWAGRLPGPRPKAGQNTCLHVFRSVATRAPNRKNPCSASFFVPRGQA